MAHLTVTRRGSRGACPAAQGPQREPAAPKFVGSAGQVVGEEVCSFAIEPPICVLRSLQPIGSGRWERRGRPCSAPTTDRRRPTTGAPRATGRPGLSLSAGDAGGARFSGLPTASPRVPGWPWSLRHTPRRTPAIPSAPGQSSSPVRPRRPRPQRALPGAAVGAPAALLSAGSAKSLRPLAANELHAGPDKGHGDQRQH